MASLNPEEVRELLTEAEENGVRAIDGIDFTDITNQEITELFELRDLVKNNRGHITQDSDRFPLTDEVFAVLLKVAQANPEKLDIIYESLQDEVVPACWLDSEYNEVDQSHPDATYYPEETSYGDPEAVLNKEGYIRVYHDPEWAESHDDGNFNSLIKVVHPTSGRDTFYPTPRIGRDTLVELTDQIKSFEARGPHNRQASETPEQDFKRIQEILENNRFVQPELLALVSAEFHSNMDHKNEKRLIEELREDMSKVAALAAGEEVILERPQRRRGSGRREPLLTLDAYDYEAAGKDKEGHDTFDITPSELLNAEVGDTWKVVMPGNNHRDCVKSEELRLAGKDGDNLILTLDRARLNDNGDYEFEREQYHFNTKEKALEKVDLKYEYSEEYEQNNNVIVLNSQSYDDPHRGSTVMITHNDLVGAKMGETFTAQADPNSDRYTIKVEGLDQTGKIELTEIREAGKSDPSGLGSVRNYKYNSEESKLEAGINTNLEITDPMDVLVIDKTAGASRAVGGVRR